jgi:myosin heavy subunit
MLRSYKNFRHFKTEFKFKRCIKPNENSFSTQFVLNVAIKQIKDSGLVEYSKVKRMNYTNKIEFYLFAKRY